VSDWYTYEDVVPRLAAAAIILSDGPDGHPEILLARRNKKLPFMGGHHVFPGGGLDKEDHGGCVQGTDDDETKRAIFAAAREVFEETGLLCVPDAPAPEVLRPWRARLLAHEAGFGQILESVGRCLNADHFVPAGIWVTPAFSPIRYRTRYFVYQHTGPHYEEAESEDGEIVGLDWLTATEARRRWQAGQIRLSTPVAFVLQHLARLPLQEALPWLHRTPGMDPTTPNRFELRRGIHLVPVRSPTLPPATHTNCIIIGEDRLLIIDPGAHDDDEQQHLLDHVAHMAALGATVEAIVLSHGHPDHTGAALRLAEAHAAPLWGHAETARQTGLTFARLLADGDLLSLPGEPGWEVVCLHTPGHDPGHLAFLERSTYTLLAGDLIANPGTIVISPDYEGDMTQYIDSLNRVIDEDFNFMIPAHGMPFWAGDAKQNLRDLVSHRMAREEKISVALAAGATTRAQVIEQAYADTPKESWPLADHQLRAHLIRLGIALKA
jgi:ribonuclease/clavin/mitogillin